MVASYWIQCSYFVDRDRPEYKTSWNEIYNNARVYTPDDKSIQTPHSDTPYSYVGTDLRTEPLVLSVPDVRADTHARDGLCFKPLSSDDDNDSVPPSV